MYDLMIVGGGPAGLSAGVYAARKRLNTLLISPDIGGQVNKTLGVENYMGYQFIEGPELIDKFQSQVDQFPIDQKIGYRVSRLEKLESSFEAVSESGDKYQAKTVIYTAGKSPRKLNVVGETELIGRGVTYCTVCDGPVFSGQKVVKLRVADLLSTRRTRTIARPRQIAMALAKELTNHSLPDIGRSFGGRDHTTVLHACRKIQELRESDPSIEEDYQLLLRILSG